MKTFSKSMLIILTITLVSCAKPDKIHFLNNGSMSGYHSMSDFYAKNGVPRQYFSIDATSGGNFTTPQGTVVTIPPGAFVNAMNQSVNGSVVIEFRDIYKKSDMLLTDKPTMMSGGFPLKSGGEFYINAFQNNVALQMDPNAAITIFQPNALTGGIQDTLMRAFVLQQDTITGTVWDWNNPNNVTANPSGYIFSFYQMNSTADTGSWCNSDNSQYFSAYTQVPISVHGTDDVSVFNTDVFIVFEDINSMLHVYRDNYLQSDFSYHYAPMGLNATIVAIGLKDGELYSSFTPITIINGMTINVTLSHTNADDFKSQLEALN